MQLQIPARHPAIAVERLSAGNFEATCSEVLLTTDNAFQAAGNGTYDTHNAVPNAFEYPWNGKVER